MILEDKKHRHDSQEGSHRELIVKVEWSKLGEKHAVGNQEREVLQVRQDRSQNIKEDVEKQDQVAKGPVRSV